MIEFTTEQRESFLIKARLAREEKKEAGKHLRQDFVDEPYFREIASKIGFRLANSYIPASDVKYIKRVLKKLDKDTEWFTMITGFKKYSDFAKANLDYAAWTVQSLLIEAYVNEDRDM